VVDAGALEVIRERDMVTHRMGFAIIASGLLCLIVAVGLWRAGHRRTATALGVVGSLVNITGCAYTQSQIML
jgi:multisubunit Na+/H+ antiporter MnhC subunit